MKLVYGLVSLLVLAGFMSACAPKQAAEKAIRPQDYGFASESEMREFLTVTNVTVKEVPSPEKHSAPQTAQPDDQHGQKLEPAEAEPESAQQTPVPPEGATSEPSQSGSPIQAQAPQAAEPEKNPETAQAPTPSQSSGIIDRLLGLAGGDVTELITVIGPKIWNLFSNNRPVSNVETDHTDVLPGGVRDWSTMSQWKPQAAAKTFVIETTNMWGFKFAVQRYTISFNHGGKHNGKGAYIANATIVPHDVTLETFFKTLKSEVKIGKPINTGTPDDPVPGIELQLVWKIAGLTAEWQGTSSFFITGKGELSETTPEYHQVTPESRVR